jgi:chromosome segregation ATPase
LDGVCNSGTTGGALMDTAEILKIIGALVTVGTLYIAWRKLKDEIELLRSQSKVNRSQEKVNETEAANTIVEAASRVVDDVGKGMNILKDAMQYAENSRKILIDNALKASAEINRLEDRLEGMTKRLDEQEEKTINYRHERETMIETLSVKLEEQGKQILSFENRVAEMKEKYNKAIELLVGLLDPDKRDVALQELSHILGDSVYKFKLPKAGK